MLNTDNLIKILYCVKVQGESKPSFPNQFDLRLVAVSNVLEKISTLQKDYAEIFCDKEHAIRNRLIGVFDGYDVCFVESFMEVKSKPNTLKVLFSDIPPSNNELDAQTVVVVTDSSLPETDEYLYLKNLTPGLLKEKALNLISNLSDEKKTELEKLKKYVGFEPGYKELSVNSEVQDGFYNKINIAILESLRLKVRRQGLSSTFNAHEIEKLVNRIIKIRAHITKELDTGGVAPAVQMYFSDTSSTFEFYRNRKNYAEILKKYCETDPKILKEAVHFCERGLISEKSPKNELIAEIEKERLLLDSLIVLSAANNVAPVIKLPLSNNKAFSQVLNLAASDRNNSRKSNALMKQVQEAFSQYLDNWLEYADSSPSLSIKLVSNFPLEWTHHQGLPLMIRHEVSRIPVTPGYVTSALLLDSRVLHLSLSNFSEILFISSFSDDDPIRDHLKDKLRKIEQMLNGEPVAMVDFLKRNSSLPADFKQSFTTGNLDIRFKWIEVSTADELIEAINENPCAITVFDLHGSHKIDGGGCIHLRNESIYASDLCEKIRISPIVILSSCDTSPVDKGHESTAEAFFLAGAKTVLSSALPIQSNPASTFLGRLLIRIQTYLPVALKNNSTLRWSTLVAGMIRRTYYSELVTLLQKEYRFGHASEANLLFRIGILLDPLHPDWVNAVEREITSMLGISIDDLNKFITNNVQFVECMKYFQLGRPELVVLSLTHEH